MSRNQIKDLGIKFGFDDSFMSRQDKKILQDIYSRKIIRIFVIRSPVNGVLKWLMNISSAGKLKQVLENSEQDDIFHLYLVLVVDGYEAYRIERNERFSISKFRREKNTTGLEIEVNGLTVENLFENYKRSLGSWNKLVFYDAVNSNCQHFVAGILNSSGLLTRDRETFIMQDTEKLLSSMPETQKLIRHIVDLGLVISVIFGGEIN